MKFFGIDMTWRSAARSVEAVSKVNGFAVSMETKEGVLLTSGKPPKPASENAYYEIAVQPTGENPEYPKRDKPMIARFTIGLAKEMSGLIGDACFIPSGARYTGFEVVEEYDDGKLKSGFMGRLMSAHHSVNLRAHFVTAQGRKEEMAMGSWVRKSECERPEWRAEAGSPMFYL